MRELSSLLQKEFSLLCQEVTPASSTTAAVAAAQATGVQPGSGRGAGATSPVALRPPSPTQPTRASTIPYSLRCQVPGSDSPLPVTFTQSPTRSTLRVETATTKAYVGATPLSPSSSSMYRPGYPPMPLSARGHVNGHTVVEGSLALPSPKGASGPTLPATAAGPVVTLTGGPAVGGASGPSMPVAGTTPPSVGTMPAAAVAVAAAAPSAVAGAPPMSARYSSTRIPQLALRTNWVTKDAAAAQAQAQAQTTVLSPGRAASHSGVSAPCSARRHVSPQGRVVLPPRTLLF